MKKIIKTVLFTILILFLITAPLYSAPKEDKDNGKGHSEEIQEPPGQAKKESSVPEPAPGPAPEPPGQANKDKSHENQGLQIGHTAKDSENKRGLQRKQSLDKERLESHNREIIPGQQVRQEIQQNIIERREERENQTILNNLEKALQKLEHSRWAYNPNDTRGQGNMGKPDMLAPFGHDKDSDRKELYGSNSRVIKIEPAPEPPPEEPPIEPEPEPDPILPPPPPPDTDPDPEPNPEEPPPILPPPPPPA